MLLKKAVRIFTIFIIFFQLGTCKVYKGNDGTGIFTLVTGERWLYGNASSLFLFDKENKLNLETIRNLPETSWIRSKHNTAFGILDTTLWLRLDVKTNTNIENWVLSLDNPSMSRMEFYVQDPITNTYIKKRGGRKVPLEELAYPSRHPVFPFSVPNGKTVRLFLKVETESATLLPLRFFTQKDYDNFDRLTGFISGAYYGAMILLLLYNLVLFFSTKDRLFLFYCIYLFCFAFFIFNSNNQWLPLVDFSQNTFVMTLSPVFSLLSTIAATVFAWVFLFPEKESTRIKKLLKISILIDMIALISLFFLPAIDHIRVANIVPMFGIMIITIAAILRFKEGFIGAKYFLIAWSFLIVSVMLFILMNLGFIDYSSFISYSPMYGSLFEGVFLSLGIGDRINLLKKEREEAKQALLESQRKALEEEKKINESISRFVPNQFLEILKRKSILEVMRGDSVEREMTILFSDIRNFTRLSESNHARDVFLLLNEYMERLGPAIAKHGGFIDKYIGDAIMALFPGGPADAIHASIAMKKEVDEMKHRLTGDFHLEAGFGIHHGSVMLGTVGESNRLDTTVIGDTVNLASRLEGLTKNFGIPILASDSVRKNIEEHHDLQFREIDSVIVKGKTKPVVIYEVLDADTHEIREAKNNSYPVFYQGMHHYKMRNFRTSLELFQECITACPEDNAAHSYAKRAKEFLENPPPDDWSGFLKL
ncbi:7TM diverse intracellular signaling domain-containing protein [Leptospira sp. 'Mane']|uniref:7TM diverse intracellular signaling domain-containing protein n=1 Tax=Leptospira sp. 'Mane' TaxID=3387407 RepID=UPI00398B36F2